MRRRRSPLMPVVAAVLAVVAAGCGIPHDDEPRITPGGLVMPAVAPSDSGPSGGGGGQTGPEREVNVFLVQAEYIVEVTRTARSLDVADALGLLLAGPTEAEFAAGIRTAISPQAGLRSVRLEGGTAVVDVSAAFAEVGGQEQILAVAQIVLTATAVTGTARVRFLLEGQPVEVPRTDGTLTAESLGAADYAGLLTPGPTRPTAPGG